MASRERVVALEIVLIIDILVLRFVIVADIHIFVSLVAHRQIEDIYNTLCVHDDNDDDDEVCVDSTSASLAASVATLLARMEPACSAGQLDPLRVVQ